jgi:fumarylacetoacetase
VTANSASTLRSFVDVPADSHFPIQNLPLGVFKPTGHGPRVGVAIGGYVLDLNALHVAGHFNGPHLGVQEGIFAAASLNPFLSLGRPAWRELRSTLQRLLSADEPALRDSALRNVAFHEQKHVQMLLPVEIGDYTDFYSSRYHANNVGILFRGPDNPLLPNWLHLPVAYHGRSSSIVVSGTNVVRPRGQSRPDAASVPLFGPTNALDFELEVAAIVGTGNPLGEPIPVERTEEHLFGLVLLNDWSARDIQAWEYAPLGPFLGKNFATSISPWVIPLDALAPFRCEGEEQSPEPLPYLTHRQPRSFDIRLEVRVQGVHVCTSNFKNLYWSLAQQVAHHTVNGCNLRVGDLLASGTISGPTPDSLGCLLELTAGGARPVDLGALGVRRFLLDGDRVTMTGYCQGDGYRVGFGEVTGMVLPG